MTKISVLTHSYYLRDPRVRRHAEALQRQGHEVVVICLSLPGELKHETVNGVRIYRLPLRHKRKGVIRYLAEYALAVFLFFIALTRLHFKSRFSLIHVNTPPDLLVFSTILCKLTGTKVLMDIHDPMPELFATKFRNRTGEVMFVSLLRWMERLATSFSDYVITVTRQVEIALVRRGLPAEKVTVIMNFADTQIFKKIRNDHPNSRIAERKKPRPILLYIGTLTRPYGVDIAIRALAFLHLKLPEACLKIVGDGEEREPLQKITSELGFDQSVSFIGQVQIDKIPEVALPADVGLAPHRRDALYDMCFPSKIYDYLALGLPVVACRTRSLEYYYGENTLSFFESENAHELAERVYDILMDDEKAGTLVTNGNRFLERHNGEKEKQRFLAVIGSLLGQETVLELHDKKIPDS